MAKYIAELKRCSVVVDDRIRLQPTSVRIGAGQRIALVGNRKSGKTTLLRLLGNFYMGYGGEIEIDGFKPGAETKAITSFIGDLDALPYELTIEKIADLYKMFYEDFDEAMFYDLLDRYGIDKSIRPRVGSRIEAQETGLFLFISRRAKLYLMDVYREEDEITDWFGMMETITTNLQEGCTFIFVADSDRMAQRFSDHVIYMRDCEIAEYSETSTFFDEHGSVADLFRSEEEEDEYDEDDDEYDDYDEDDDDSVEED